MHVDRAHAVALCQGVNGSDVQSIAACEQVSGHGNVVRIVSATVEDTEKRDGWYTAYTLLAAQPQPLGGRARPQVGSHVYPHGAA